MTIDEEIEMLQYRVKELAKLGYLDKVEEYSQVIVWLKELKSYREQDRDAINNLAMNHILNHEVKWINERWGKDGGKE